MKYIELYSSVQCKEIKKTKQLSAPKTRELRIHAVRDVYFKCVGVRYSAYFDVCVITTSVVV